MVRAMHPGGKGGPSPTGLADVIEIILHKGLVIDAYVRLSEGLPGLLGGTQQSSARHITKGILQGVGDKLREHAESESQPASGRRSRKWY